MTPRKAGLQEREKRILAITVDEYIETVSPVSSSCIVQKYKKEDLSSATIRNVLAELEEEGYLTHPHTSAGRVPTQRGYRYYVDNMKKIQLWKNEKARIRAEYTRESAELDQLLEKTSRVLSETTHCTSLVSVDGWGNRIFCQGTSFVVEYPDYQDISKIRGILAALDEKERLLQLINKELEERTAIFIGKELECEDIDTCSLVVARYQAKDGPSGRIAVLGPTRMDYKRVLSTLDYFSDLIEEIL